MSQNPSSPSFTDVGHGISMILDRLEALRKEAGGGEGGGGGGGLQQLTAQVQALQGQMDQGKETGGAGGGMAVTLAEALAVARRIEESQLVLQRTVDQMLDLIQQIASDKGIARVA